MQKGHQLQFKCQECASDVLFSVAETQKGFSCPQCKKQYVFEDPQLNKQLSLFVSLCEAIKNAEEILSDTHIGIDIGEHHVEIPYKLLLTRLNTTLDLTVGDKPLKIAFRVEPLKEKIQ
jgi:hypothetical protein